jgi:hypothetical protein
MCYTATSDGDTSNAYRSSVENLVWITGGNRMSWRCIELDYNA